MSSEKHLLIDGANFLQGLPGWREKYRRSRPEARAELATLARQVHDSEAMRVTVVFDGRGAELRIERAPGEQSFAVIHTPDGLTADDVIERLVANSASPGDCLVVTADRAMGDTVTALGGGVMAPADFATWLERCGRRQTQRLCDRQQENDRKWQQPRS